MGRWGVPKATATVLERSRAHEHTSVSVCGLSGLAGVFSVYWIISLLC